jgi:23S rRNA maturation-related 3'-5' exoribonuclease YhaM
VEKIYSNTKGPSVSYLPSIKYKNGKLKTGFILLSGEIEKKLIESIEDLYRKYSPEKVSQFIDFRSVYLGVAGGDSVLCEIIMKNDDDARDFRKVFIDIKSTSTFHFDARKKLREQIDKVLELCEQNSPAETVFDLEEIKVYPR